MLVRNDLTGWSLRGCRQRRVPHGGALHGQHGCAGQRAIAHRIEDATMEDLLSLVDEAEELVSG